MRKEIGFKPRNYYTDTPEKRYYEEEDDKNNIDDSAIKEQLANGDLLTDQLFYGELEIIKKR